MSFRDHAMKARVKGALLSDPLTRKCVIQVRASHGTVFLRGTVTRAEVALHAQQLALNVTGVDVVLTRLTWQDGATRNSLRYFHR